jgi:acyl-CoA thioesterase FadM
MGVVNNAVFLTLFEQARFGYFHALGVMSGETFPFVLGSTAARFESPGRSGMRVLIAARVVRLGNKSLDMDYVVRSEGATLATGAATLVWVDSQLRSTAIPDSVRAAIAAREGIPPRG